jgi:hypothetical protein
MGHAAKEGQAITAARPLDPNALSIRRSELATPLLYLDVCMWGTRRRRRREPHERKTALGVFLSPLLESHLTCNRLVKEP